MDDYRKMRLFSTPEGDAGFALKGDDIVSVFKHPKAPYRGVTKSMLDIATAEGGRRLDAFDTVLPHIYSQSGFRAAARLPFNDQYAPEGWDREVFKDHNGGRPDVVFMAHDPQAGSYQPGDGQTIDDYDHGEHHQRRVLDEVQRRGPTTPAAPGPESYGSGQLIRSSSPTTIWHGTPHEFRGTRANPLGEFDISKLGTGEGAQVFGHGIYQAENERVAKGYRDDLSGGVTYKGQVPAPGGTNPSWHAVHSVAEHMEDRGTTAEQAIEAMIEAHNVGAANFMFEQRGLRPDVVEANRKRSEFHMGVVDALQRLDPKDFAHQTGQLYESELHIHPDHILDWDKPIEHQSQYVQDRLRDVTDQYKGTPHKTGEFVHAILANPTYRQADKAQAARELLRRGIPGLRYLDNHSRRAAEEHRTETENTASHIANLKAAYLKRTGDPDADPYGDIASAQRKLDRLRANPPAGLTYNHVVFDPRTIHIVKRNGLPAMVDAGADALRDHKKG